MLSIGFISLGCSKNLVDSQVMAGLLLKSGMQLAPSPDQADVILVNTCAFIAPAREEAAQNILAACKHKAQGKCKAVIVAGCMPQRYRKQMCEAFPEVDAFLGVDELDAIADIVKTATEKPVTQAQKKPASKSAKSTSKPHAKMPPVHVAAGLPTRLFNPTLPGLRFTGPAFSYLKVAEGCNHACAFCAIPGFRGHLRSRPLNDIVYEAEKLLETGAKEINLIAQDITSYGKDVRGGPQIADLLKRLDKCDGDFWLRLLYGFPNHVTPELLEVLATSTHVARYLDLPIQHAHPDILRAMRRADTIAKVPTFPEAFRKAVPGLTLRTTCMVGYPGETEEHFKFLCDYIKEAKFDHLGAFIFSPEEGTPAAELDGLPDPEVAKDRYQRLMRIQQRISKQRALAHVGSTQKALIIDFDGGEGAIARIERQAPDVDGETAIAQIPDSVQPGDFVQVKVTAATAYALTAQLL